MTTNTDVPMACVQWYCACTLLQRLVIKAEALCRPGKQHFQSVADACLQGGGVTTCWHCKLEVTLIGTGRYAEGGQPARLKMITPMMIL